MVSQKINYDVVNSSFKENWIGNQPDLTGNYVTKQLFSSSRMSFNKLNSLLEQINPTPQVKQRKMSKIVVSYICQISFAKKPAKTQGSFILSFFPHHSP